MSDLMRIVAFLLGGASLGAIIPVLRRFIRDGDRTQAFVARLFGIVHVSVVLFLFAILAERIGEPLTWYTPAAVGIFTTKLIAVWMLREIVLEQESRAEPPQRRAGDLS